MKTAIPIRESQKVSELANDYKRKGYDVVLPSSQGEGPAFLKNHNYIPDLIVRSKNENLIIEVKSRQTSQDLNQLSDIAELINAQADWQFVVVFTNPRESGTVLTQPNTKKAKELLQKSRDLHSKKQAHIEAAFLFAWVALEASLHLLPERRKSLKRPTTPWTLIRNATMDGYISRDDSKILERLFRIRNSLLHAGNEDSPTIKEIIELRKIAEDIIQTYGVEEL